jgi:hypothetical protein
MITVMIEAARTSETSVDIELRTRQYIPGDSELHIRRRENLKMSHRFIIISYEVLTALDAVVVSSAVRIATRNRRAERRVAMLLIRIAVTHTVLALRVAVWERRYVAPLADRYGSGRSSWVNKRVFSEYTSENKKKTSLFCLFLHRTNYMYRTIL